MFPEPVCDNRKKEKQDDEPTVYIFGDATKVYCSFADQPRVLSNSTSVKQPGILEKISIARSQREFEYSCSTNIYQACKSFKLLTFCSTS